MVGWEAWLLLFPVVGSFFFFLPNKAEYGSGSSLVFSSPFLTLNHVDDEELRRCESEGVDAYACAALLDPWRQPDSSAVAPFSPPHFFSNNLALHCMHSLAVYFALFVVVGVNLVGSGFMSGSLRIAASDFRRFVPSGGYGGDGRSRSSRSELMGYCAICESEGTQAAPYLPSPKASISQEDSKPGVAVERAHQHRRFGGSYAAQGGGRWAAFSGGYAARCFGRLAVFPPLMLLLAEWRSLFFLPASVPDGRQCLFHSVSMVHGHGIFVVPSGVIPGGGEVLVWKLCRTRLLSLLGCRGPLCISQGLICNFLFSFGSLCKMRCC